MITFFFICTVHFGCKGFEILLNHHWIGFDMRKTISPAGNINETKTAKWIGTDVSTSLTTISSEKNGTKSHKNCTFPMSTRNSII